MTASRLSLGFALALLAAPLLSSGATATAIIKTDLKSSSAVADPAKNPTGTICTFTSVDDMANRVVGGAGADPKPCTIHPDPVEGKPVVNIGGVGGPAQPKFVFSELNNTWSPSRATETNTTIPATGGVSDITASWNGSLATKLVEGQQVKEWGIYHRLSGVADPDFVPPFLEEESQANAASVAGEVLDPLVFIFPAADTLFVEFTLGIADTANDPDPTAPGLFIKSSSSRETNRVVVSVSLTPIPGTMLTLDDEPFQGNLFTLFLESTGIIRSAEDITVIFEPGEMWLLDPLKIVEIEDFILAHLVPIAGGFGFNGALPLFRDVINPGDPDEIHAPLGALRFSVTPGTDAQGNVIPGVVTLAYNTALISEVPEPATAWLLAAGLGLIALMSFRAPAGRRWKRG